MIDFAKSASNYLFTYMAIVAHYTKKKQKNIKDIELSFTTQDFLFTKYRKKFNRLNMNRTKED